MRISYQSFKQKKKALEQVGSVQIITGSMSPLIAVNDIVPFEKYTDQKLVPFDIIIFWQRDKLICHFFVKKVGNLYITKGLRSQEFDSPVEKKHILGIVTSPKIGKVKRFILSKIIK